MDNNPFALLSDSPPSSDMAEATHESPPMSATDLAKMNMSTLVEGSSFCYTGIEPGPLPTDSEGRILHEGLRDPGFVIDCMAWGILDDYTGVWKEGQGVPPYHYFNCLRYWSWAHNRDPAYPQNIRDIPLPKKEIVQKDTEAHDTAMHAAWGLWADEYLYGTKSETFSTASLPPPIGHPKSSIWADDKSQVLQPPFTASPERYRAPSAGGVPLSTASSYQSISSGSNMGNFRMVTIPGRADSVITGMDTSPPKSIRRSTDFSSTPSGSPVKCANQDRRLSALAPSFNPGNILVNPALSSRAALPTPPGQLPGTFDVLLQNQKRNFTCILITDVPFNVTTNEILTHLKLGEREGLVHYGTDNPGIHIIQDRSDSKTHEVYVEMLTYDAASRVIRDIPRRGIKIGSTGGSRKIRVELCAQDVLMRAIFPRPTKAHAWQFRWLGYDPDLNTVPDPFIGYLSSEDLHNARDWAEHPRKAKHADDAPQRVYEFMISTLIHLPKEIRAYGRLKSWRDVQEFVDRLFATVVAMLRTLNQVIDDPRFAERHVRRECAHQLNFRLLKRFNQTCYDFPLFSERQRELLLMGI